MKLKRNKRKFTKTGNKILQGVPIVGYKINNYYLDAIVTKHSFSEYVKASIEGGFRNLKNDLIEFSEDMVKDFADSIEFKRKNEVSAIINNKFQKARYFINKESKILFVVADGVILTSYLVNGNKIRSQYREIF